MITMRMRWAGWGFFTVLLAGSLMAMPVSHAQDKHELNLGKIPRNVMEALRAKFPNADIHKWTKEKEGDFVVYDIEFKQGNRKFEADIRENGTIHNWERAITVDDLSEVVKNAVRTRYSKAALKEVMEITAVMDGKDALEGYEIVLETVNKKEVEVTVAPDGTILEDSGKKK